MKRLPSVIRLSTAKFCSDLSFLCGTDLLDVIGICWGFVCPFFDLLRTYPCIVGCRAIGCPGYKGYWYDLNNRWRLGTLSSETSMTKTKGIGRSYAILVPTAVSYTFVLIREDGADRKYTSSLGIRKHSPKVCLVQKFSPEFCEKMPYTYFSLSSFEFSSAYFFWYS